MIKLNTIGGRLLMLPTAALLGLVLLALVSLNALNDTLEKERESRVVAVVALASGIIKHYQSLEKNKTLNNHNNQISWNITSKT